MNETLFENMRTVMAAVQGRKCLGSFSNVNVMPDSVSVHLNHGCRSAERLLGWFYLLDEPQIVHHHYEMYIAVEVHGRHHGSVFKAWTGFYTPAERELLTELPDNAEARLSVHRLRRVQMLQACGDAA